MTKIIIPNDITVSLNLMLDLAKTHWSKFYKMQQSIVNIIYYYLKEQKIEPILKYPVKIEIDYFCANKRRDPDNISASKKFILDALVKAGIISGDGWEETSGGFNERFYIDRVNPRIEVSIIEQH